MFFRAKEEQLLFFSVSGSCKRSVSSETGTLQGRDTGASRSSTSAETRTCQVLGSAKQTVEHSRENGFVIEGLGRPILATLSLNFRERTKNETAMIQRPMSEALG